MKLLSILLFSFALLTDTHISHSNPRPTEDLQRSVEDINRHPNIAFVIATGDLTENGDRASIELVKNKLDQLNVPYYVASGNHETTWSESGVMDFSRVFGNSRFAFSHNEMYFIVFNSGPVIRMADGHVAPQDITWLKHNLDSVSNAGDSPIFVFTHYPLRNGDVDNWYEVTDVLRQHNVQCIMGGHYHRNLLFDCDGIANVLNRSNLRDNDTINGYSIITITDSIRIYERTPNSQSPITAGHWLSLPFGKQTYAPSDESLRPDFSVNKEYSKVKEQWVVQTGVGIYCSPAVEKDKVFIGDDMGYLTAYKLKNGKKLWSFQSGKRIIGTPAVSEGIVVFGSADRNIYGLNAENGQLLWKVLAQEPVIGAVTIDNGLAYVGASDHTFRAIDIHTGKVVWSYDKVKGYIETKPLITDNKVIFGAWDNTLYALDKTNGKELWKWTGGLTRMHFSPAAVWPVAAEGKVFIADPQRALTAIDINNGETIWRTFESQVRETVGLSEDETRIYSKTMNDSIVCFATQGNTPKKLWTSNVGFGYEHAPSMPQEKEGVMYGSTKEGLIFALNAQTGEVIWKHKIGNSLINTIVPLNKKEVLFTATSGEVGLLKMK